MLQKTSFKTDLYIDGAWRKASDGARFDVVNPADESVLASVASATVEDTGMLEFMEKQYISASW